MFPMKHQFYPICFAQGCLSSFQLYRWAKRGGTPSSNKKLCFGGASKVSFLLWQANQNGSLPKIKS
jgi:hypothetical protein